MAARDVPKDQKKAAACRGVVAFEDEASFWLDGSLHWTWAPVGHQPFRVMTWNVFWRWGGDYLSRAPGILETVRRHRPDVLGLCETWAGEGWTEVGENTYLYKLCDDHHLVYAHGDGLVVLIDGC